MMVSFFIISLIAEAKTYTESFKKNEYRKDISLYSAYTFHLNYPYVAVITVNMLQL